MKQEKYIKNVCGEKLFVETFVPIHINSTIVFCHGITGCRKGRTKEDTYFQDLASQLMDLGNKVVLFDFSGHGDSEGNDYDVTLSKSCSELRTIINEEVDDKANVMFLCFSYGAAVLCEYLNSYSEVNPKKILLISPCLFPNESCFLNKSSIFGKDIVHGIENGSFKRDGFILVGAKGFKVGKKIIEECKFFYPSYFEKIAERILVLSGSEDVILTLGYNDIFCRKNNIKQKYFKASHSLFEQMDSVFDEATEFFTKS